MECSCGESLSFAPGEDTVTCPKCSAKWASPQSEPAEDDGFTIVEEGGEPAGGAPEKLKKCPYCMAQAPIKSQICPACGREFRSARGKATDGRPSRAEKELLLEIARAQRFVCMVILIGILVWGGMVFAVTSAPHLLGVVYVAMTAISVLQVISMYWLGRAVYSPAAGCLMSILAFMPCLGYAALLIANSKATQILRDHGFHVGLMGASLREIQAD